VENDGKPQIHYSRQSVFIEIWNLVSAQVNKSVRQGYDLLPVLFNLYINTFFQEFGVVINMGIQLTNRKIIYFYFANGRYIECLSLTYATNKSKA